MAYKHAGNRYEYTATFSGSENSGRVEHGSITMPELTHYGYDGLHGYEKSNRIMERELIRKVKASLGLTGKRCKRETYGNTLELRPCGTDTVICITFSEASE